MTSSWNFFIKLFLNLKIQESIYSEAFKSNSSLSTPVSLLTIIIVLSFIIIKILPI